MGDCKLKYRRHFRDNRTPDIQCAVESCVSHVVANGLCTKHYHQYRENRGVWAPPLRAEQCPDCDKLLQPGEQCQECLDLDRDIERLRLSLVYRARALNRHPFCRVWLDLQRIQLTFGGPVGQVPLDLLMRVDADRLRRRA